ncbi:MAG: prepilin-type N-terminal cleavage/methylation domain-containing protein [Candidatus Falkowbacteria bacterium]|nr:prepilin-type N-terminal cleavage/methylation domain-containing protein [Candidatus Falkowbacteria bacterium]
MLQNRKLKSGFTLIELLVVIAIIGALSTMAIIALGNARAKSRDAKRVADIKQISTALELYYSDYNSYPTIITPGNSLSSPDGTKVYMSVIPSNPSPRTDGNCPDNNYAYGYVTSTNKYALGFCLGNSVSSLNAGVQTASVDTGLGNAGLVGWWKFDEGSGTTVIDSIGNSTGTWSGTGSPRYVAGKVGPYAGQFNGSDDYVNFGNSIALNGTRTTIIGWAKFTTLGGIALDNSNSYRLIASDVNGSRLSARFATTNVSWSSGTVIGSTSLSISQWYHVAFTYDGSYAKVWLNGKEDGVTAATGDLMPSGRNNFIGTYNYFNCCFFNGVIDDVRIYNRALSAAEILALYNATK